MYMSIYVIIDWIENKQRLKRFDFEYIDSFCYHDTATLDQYFGVDRLSNTDAKHPYYFFHHIKPISKKIYV